LAGNLDITQLKPFLSVQLVKDYLVIQIDSVTPKTETFPGLKLFLSFCCLTFTHPCFPNTAFLLRKRENMPSFSEERERKREKEGPRNSPSWWRLKELPIISKMYITDSSKQLKVLVKLVLLTKLNIVQSILPQYKLA